MSQQPDEKLFHEDIFPGNISAFKSLKEYCVVGQLTVFSGAGVSTPIFPTWTGLLQT
jgi:hypothetical protein